MSNAAGFAIVLSALGALVGAVKALRTRGRLSAESSRKAVHMGMGVVCLAFPLLFTNATPVWALAVLASVALAALRLVPALKARFGSVLHGVERFSLGELYFPFGVAAVFTLANDRRLLFVIPVAILTFADAAGALVGKRFGRTRYATVEGQKSVEGSLAVGVVAAACVAIPLSVAGYTPGPIAVMAVLVGLFCLLVEAISWRGLDNLFMPLAAFAQIASYVVLPMHHLLTRLAVLVAITVGAFVWRRGRWIDGSARLGSAVALYFFWVVGGWEWTIAPILFLTCYVRLMPRVPGGEAVHNLVAVICVCSAAVVCGAARALAPDPLWLWPFTVSFATQQAVVATVRFSQSYPRWGRTAWWGMGVLQGAAVQLPAFRLIDRGHSVPAWEYGVGFAVIVLGNAVFCLWERQLQEPDNMTARWWKQGFAGAAATLLATVVIFHP